MSCFLRGFPVFPAVPPPPPPPDSQYIELFRSWIPTTTLSCSAPGFPVHWAVPLLDFQYIELFRSWIPSALSWSAPGFPVLWAVPLDFQYIELFRSWIPSILSCSASGFPVHWAVPLMDSQYIELFRSWIPGAYSELSILWSSVQCRFYLRNPARKSTRTGSFLEGFRPVVTLCSGQGVKSNY